MSKSYLPPSRQNSDRHQRGKQKLERIPIKVKPKTPLKKPAWIRAKLPQGPKVQQIRRLLRQYGLASVCEEAQCPNLGECFHHGTATFMIMGDICTRRCPFCDVAHGQPAPLNPEEPQQLAAAIQAMQLRYVVITSVDRDDLRDGGAAHYAQCIQAIRQALPATKIEILTPDFRGRLETALKILSATPPDVFNHNLETVPRLYKAARPGADYSHSLKLLQSFKQLCPQVPTKSGLMLGLGESLEEIKQVLQDLRAHQVDMLTLGQYLQPSRDHLPVARYWSPDEFTALRDYALALGFTQVASAPLVRSSYHADLQAQSLIT